MSKASLKSPKIIATAFVLLLGAGAGVWGLTNSRTEHAKPTVQIPPEFTVDALLKTAPEQGFNSFRQAMERTDLTDEQKDQIRENGMQAREKMMDERINEYFACPNPEERKKLLDKQIDEMQKMFERMRQEREAREAQRDQQSDQDKDKERERWRSMRDRMNNMSQAERKTRSESRSTDKQARQMTYRQAMQDRMQERGIQNPFGGRGGPGGGPGGGGTGGPKVGGGGPPGGGS